MDEAKRLLLEQRKLEAMRSRIAKESFMTIEEVRKHLGVARSTVEAYPEEILPRADMKPAGSSKQLLRFHPADVLALPARLRAWRRAQARGEGEAFLAALREERELEDRAAIQAASQMRRELLGLDADGQAA